MNSNSGIRYRGIGSVVEVFPAAADHAPLCTRDSATSRPAERSASDQFGSPDEFRWIVHVHAEDLVWSLVHPACARHHGDPRWTAHIYPGALISATR